MLAFVACLTASKVRFTSYSNHNLRAKLTNPSPAMPFKATPQPSTTQGQALSATVQLQ